MWIVEVVESLNLHESESVLKIEFECNDKTTRVKLGWFMTTRTAAASPLLSLITLPRPKNRALFQLDPKVCFQIFKDKKDINQQFAPFKTKSEERYRFGIWAKLDNREIVEKLLLAKYKTYCGGGGEVRSANKFFWTNHSKERLKSVLSERYLNGLTSLKKWIEFLRSTQGTWEEIDLKRPKNTKNAKNCCFFAY